MINNKMTINDYEHDFAPLNVYFVLFIIELIIVLFIWTEIFFWRQIISFFFNWIKSFHL